MMRFRRALLIFVASLASLPIGASPDGAPAASAVLSDAYARAKKENKVVMVAFHASWCGWCHKMDAVLKRPEVQPVFDKYFITAWLTVLESADKKHLENPGAIAVLNENGGDKQGIPFFYFANPKTQKTIVNSMRPGTGDDKGGNIGCPAESFEIEYFLKMVKKAVPRIPAKDLAVLKAGFETVKAGG